MDFISLTQSRRSIRSFLPDPVTKENILKLLEAARHAPSGGNRQPWHFTVIADKAVQSEILARSCRQEFILAAPVFIVVCADIPLSEARYGDRGRSLYCLQDTAAAIQNLLLCAAELGLGTCWCGAFDEKALSGILNLPNNLRPVAIIPVGYPGNEPSPTSRRPIEEITAFIGI